MKERKLTVLGAPYVICSQKCQSKIEVFHKHEVHASSNGKEVVSM
jgi:hypothetical protein